MGPTFPPGREGPAVWTLPAGMPFLCLSPSSLLRDRRVGLVLINLSGLTCSRQQSAVPGREPFAGRRFQPVLSDRKSFIWVYFHSDSCFSVESAVDYFSSYCDQIYITKFAIFTIFLFLSAHTTQWHELHSQCHASISTVCFQNIFISLSRNSEPIKRNCCGFF